MKKIKLLFLFLLLPFVAHAYDAYIDEIYYDLDTWKKTATVTDRYRYSPSNSYSGVVNIPETIIYNGETYSVTSIGREAFYECSGLTSVTIPNSVISIDKSAFYKCISLTTVNISDIEAWCKISFYNDDSNPLSYAHHLYLDGNEITELNIYGAQNEAYNVERGRKTPKAVYLQRVARVEALRSAQNETFT